MTSMTSMMRGFIHNVEIIRLKRLLKLRLYSVSNDGQV